MPAVALQHLANHRGALGLAEGVGAGSVAAAAALLCIEGLAVSMEGIVVWDYCGVFGHLVNTQLQAAAGATNGICAVKLFECHQPPRFPLHGAGPDGLVGVIPGESKHSAKLLDLCQRCHDNREVRVPGCCSAYGQRSSRRQGRPWQRHGGQGGRCPEDSSSRCSPCARPPLPPRPGARLLHSCCGYGTCAAQPNYCCARRALLPGIRHAHCCSRAVRGFACAPQGTGQWWEEATVACGAACVPPKARDKRKRRRRRAAGDAQLAHALLADACTRAPHLPPHPTGGTGSGPGQHSGGCDGL